MHELQWETCDRFWQMGRSCRNDRRVAWRGPQTASAGPPHAFPAYRLGAQLSEQRVRKASCSRCRLRDSYGHDAWLTWSPHCRLHWIWQCFSGRSGSFLWTALCVCTAFWVEILGRKWRSVSQDFVFIHGWNRYGNTDPLKRQFFCQLCLIFDNMMIKLTFDLALMREKYCAENWKGIIFWAGTRSIFDFAAKNRVYACVVSRKDYLVHKQTGHFDLAHYTAHPEEYESIFAEKVRWFFEQFPWNWQYHENPLLFFNVIFCRSYYRM